jgi:hypothetical protein
MRHDISNYTTETNSYNVCCLCVAFYLLSSLQGSGLHDQVREEGGPGLPDPCEPPGSPYHPHVKNLKTLLGLRGSQHQIPLRPLQLLLDGALLAI